MAFPFRRNAGGKQSPPTSNWLLGDWIPAPEVVQRESDSAWAEWTEISARHEARFAETQPATRAPNLPEEEAAWANTLPVSSTAAPPAEPPPPSGPTAETALRLARRNKRVCPRPQCWELFSCMLPARRTPLGVQQPPPAVTGAAWAATPERAKRICFREQVEWADRVGMLQQAIDFMQAMSEEDWLHEGESDQGVG